jgi:hypothetical protein
MDALVSQSVSVIMYLAGACAPRLGMSGLVVHLMNVYTYYYILDWPCFETLSESVSERLDD